MAPEPTTITNPKNAIVVKPSSPYQNIIQGFMLILHGQPFKKKPGDSTAGLLLTQRRARGFAATRGRRLVEVSNRVSIRFVEQIEKRGRFKIDSK